MTTNKARRPVSDSIEIADFDVLLQFSLWLSKNGRSAAWSVRDIMTEGNQYCHDWMSKRNRENWLRNAATSKDANMSKAPLGAAVRLTPSDTGQNRASDRDKSTSANATAAGAVKSPLDEYDVANQAKAIAGLPGVFRSAMILSDLEGFSYREIADLAGVTPKLVAKLLKHGHKILLNNLQAGSSTNNAQSHI